MTYNLSKIYLLQTYLEIISYMLYILSFLVYRLHFSGKAKTIFSFLFLLILHLTSLHAYQCVKFCSFCHYVVIFCEEATSPLPALSLPSPSPYSSPCNVNISKKFYVIPRNCVLLAVSVSQKLQELPGVRKIDTCFISKISQDNDMEYNDVTATIR